MLYGRDPERAVIGALLDAARESRSGALVLRGDAGIGKTALLEDARERADDMQVLTARGVESESELPFAALHQLVRPALDRIEDLPVPQASAMRVALGLAEGAAPERFLVFAACLSLLSELAERRPVLCLVDDAHWLDAPSADTLLFVARRLDAEGIALLLAAREGDVRRFEAPDIPSLELSGLDADAAALLARGAGVAAAAPVLDRLVERTGGNALALIELPSVLSEAQLAGDAPLPEALPLTREVERTFLERARRLGAESQRLLLAAAADDTERAAVVADAAGRLGAGPDALDGVERAGLVTVSGSRLTFRHPLVRSAVYSAATSTERRAAHRALADALAGDDRDADRRAWHLAASAIDADEDAVRALEEAAERAAGRAGHAAAARALERAAELSVDAPARGRRLVAAARAASLAGAAEQAAALARAAQPLVDDPSLRADIARVLGLAEIQRGRPHEVSRMLIEAARDVSTADPGTALDLLAYAISASSQGRNGTALHEACALAASVTPSAGDDEQAFMVLALTGSGAMMQGDPARGAPFLERALERASAADDPRRLLYASICALWLGDDDRMGALLGRGMLMARARGTLGTLAELLGLYAAQLLLRQDYDGAAIAAEEAAQLARELRAGNLELSPLSTLAYVAGVRGQDDVARALGGDALERAIANGLTVRAAQARYALAVAELSHGRWIAALERFESLAQPHASGAESFLILMSIPEMMEAAVRAGRPDAARAALPLFERWAVHSGAAWAQPRLEACRALLADGTEATAHFTAALELAADARPFDLARIRLLFGEHLRRQRRRVDARAQLRAALEEFERLGATPWAERSRVELRASGETARRRDPGAAAALTPQELQIARLVSEGLSNKDVAAQLYLSPRTIESHLRKAFVKLGITSRTQLARLPLGDEVAA